MAKKTSFMDKETFEIDKYVEIFRQPENLIFCIQKIDYNRDRFAIYLRLENHRRKLIKGSMPFLDIPSSVYYTSPKPELLVNSRERSRGHLKEFLNRVLTQGNKLGLNKKGKLSRKFINAVFERLKEKNYKSVSGSEAIKRNNP